MRSRIRLVRERMNADEGSISLLTLGWVLIAVVALLVMAAATQLHVDRMRLASLADELALAAADELDVGSYYSATATSVALDEGAMREAAAAWLVADPRPWVEEVGVVDVSASPDGTATVAVARRVRPLFDIEALAAFGDGIMLTAEGRARAG
ncbi:pilus assembly protein TadG-related protein [Demequina sp. SO4-18]|uniref:pilus assembly protein TadG-related protein n=1 Tax=Demequina sp. SO4-18 TaxID=3401026 RepID=UPI003B5BEE24